MLHDRHEFDVREALVLQVTRQLRGEAAPAEHRVSVAAPPRAGVQLVYRLRCVWRVLRRAARHPLRVAPLVRRRAADHRGGRGRRLAEEGERVALFENRARLRSYRVFINFSRSYAGDEALPNSGGIPARREPVAVLVPRVEISDDRYASRAGSPDREERAALPFVLHDVRPEEGVDAAVRPFAEKINIVVGGQRRPVYHLSHKHRLRLCLCYYSVSLNTGGTKMSGIFSYNKITPEIISRTTKCPRTHTGANTEPRC